MREVIQDIVKHTGNLGFIGEVKITGTAESTLIEGMDDDKVVFIKGALKTAQPEFVGTFGIKSLSLLNGLCNFANYKSDGASLLVKRREHGETTAPEELQFRDATGSGSDFRLVNANLIAEQAIIASINWDVVFQPNKSKIQEFTQLASLYGEFEKWFGVKTKDGDLVFNIGEENSSMHRASMVFESGITGSLKGDLIWPISQVLGILKLPGSPTMSFTSRGMMQVTVESDFGKYDYLFPTRRR
jgi:hypothetical protein